MNVYTVYLLLLLLLFEPCFPLEWHRSSVFLPGILRSFMPPSPGIRAVTQLICTIIPRSTWFPHPPFFRKEDLRRFPAVGWSMSLNSVSTGLSKFCSDPSPGRWGQGASSLQQYISFSFGDIVKRVFVCLVRYDNLFRLATAPFSVAVWPYDGVALRSG
jgi:hypothetical protein